MANSLNVRLEPPETTLGELSFANTSTTAINQWAAALPVVNIEETGAQLKLATAELALLDAPPADKYEYLEAVRPLLHYIGTRLDRAALSSAKSAKESQAQRLLLNLCNGYKGVVLDAVEGLENDKSVDKDLLPQAIHRLISDLSRVLLRALQLYLQPPPNFWWEINELFRLAETLGVTDFKHTDDENHSGEPLSIKQAYLRALLLAACKPNQLQQAQLAQVFNVLETWTEPVTLAKGRSDALLVIDVEGNTGPQFNTTPVELVAPRGLHTEVLAYEIEAFLKGVDGSIVIPSTLSKRLLRHLVDAWSLMHPRGFSRFPTNAKVRVAVGLRASHYFLSGGCNFNDQISNTNDLLRREVNPFLDVHYEAAKSEDQDPWSQAHDLKVKIPVNPNITAPERILLENSQREEPIARAYEHFETIAVDSSAGGYRMEWLDTVPPNATVGELIALREEKSPRWCVAVIRWLRQENKRISMGVELISPRAIPVAVRAIQKRGGPTDFARGLMLPAIKGLNLPATLITPRVPFEERQKVHIQRQGIQTTAQLLESQLKTESVNRFTFRMLDGYLENARTDSNIESLSAMTREDTSQGS